MNDAELGDELKRALLESPALDPDMVRLPAVHALIRRREVARHVAVAAAAVGVVIVAVTGTGVALAARHDNKPTAPAVSGLPSGDATASTGTHNPTPTPTGPAGDAASLCLPSQLALGAPTHAPGFSSFGTQSEYVKQPVQNSGPTCTFPLPTTIEVASATGPFSTVPVLNAGNGTTYQLARGARTTITLGAWWPMPKTSTAARCDATTVDDVSRVGVPLGTDALHIELGTVLPQACSSPPSMSITVGG